METINDNISNNGISYNSDNAIDKEVNTSAIDNINATETVAANKESDTPKAKPIRIKKNITEDEIEAQIQALLEAKKNLQEEAIRKEKEEREKAEKEAVDNFTRDLQTLQTTLNNDRLVKAFVASGMTAEDVELAVVKALAHAGNEDVKTALVGRYKRITSKASIYEELSKSQSNEG